LILVLKETFMNENEMMQDDEISLFDLFEKLRDGWLTVVGGTVLGVAGAVLAIFLIPSKYEAVAVVQVGQVGQVGQVAQVGLVGLVSSVALEPTQQVVERMKTPTFQMAVAQGIGSQDWIDALSRSGGSAVDYLTLQVAKATIGQTAAPLMELKAKAGSPAEAQKIAEVAIQELSKRQGEIARPAIERMQGDLAIAKEKRQSAQTDLESLGKLVSSAGVKDERFTQLSLMNNLRLQKESELFFQRQMVAALEAALNPPATQAARAIEAVYVSEKPVSPKKSLLLVLGTIGGLLVGVLWVFGADTWRRARDKRTARPD
jgi:LPS O-antigen subunit length determinant protein (WzzB/FepE family)